MSRTYTYQALVDDASSVAPGSLGDLGINPDFVYAGQVDTPGGDLFLILRHGQVNPGIGLVNTAPLIVWVYQRQTADYLELDDILKRIRELFTSIEAQETSEGYISQIDWVGDSDDFVDDVYHAIARTASFTLIGSGR